MGKTIYLNPLVSIIVPVYNLERYIVACLKSLICQSYKNLQIIVVDDGSKDSSWNQITKMAKSDLRILAVHQENGGVSSARNKGLELSCGDLLMFVDGDDMLERFTIEKLVRYFAKHNLDWVEFPVIRTDEFGNILQKIQDFGGFYPKKCFSVPKDKIYSLLVEHRLSELSCGCLYRSDFAKQMRFPVDEYYEDSFFFTDVLKHTNCGYVTTEGQYLYVERPGSSQLSIMSKERIRSQMHCVLDRVEKISPLADGDNHYLYELEYRHYYYLKTLIAKGNKNAQKVLRDFLLHCKYPKPIKWSIELKLFVYRFVGYKRLKRWLKL